MLPQTVHIAMSQLEARVGELPVGKPVVVYCEHGVRSLHVAAWLLQKGYQAESLAGGFAEWDGDILDPNAEAP